MTWGALVVCRGKLCSFHVFSGCFFIYLALGEFMYRWGKLKYEELVGEKPREDDRFMISIFIFSRSNE